MTIGLFLFNNICETLRLDPASLRLALTDGLIRESLKFTENGKGLENLARELGR
jgi:hypothetical protein